uniref:Lymphocyte antigen 6 family member K n=1 Tax=Callithrix jacchus TaxID=9483 RepID=A0A2R8P502_CALJA
MTLLALLLLAMALPRVWTDANLTARQRDPEDTPQKDTGDDRIWCHVCERENTFDCENPRMCKSEESYCVVAAVRPSSGLLNSDSTQHLLSSPSASMERVGH